MAIRYVEAGCTMDYMERKAFQEETGVELGYAKPVLRNVYGEPELKMGNGQDEQLGLFYVKKDVTSHEGRVVAVEREHSVRIMSDVWADLTFVVVYEPNGPEGVGSEDILERMEKGMLPGHKPGMFRRIQVANSEFGGPAGAVYRYNVDAPDWLMEVYEAHKAGFNLRKKLSEYDRRQDDILAERRTVRPDKWVRVVRGRKVKIGTEGLVFWTGDSQWGRKVGIAIPQEDGTFKKEKAVGRYGKEYERYADVRWTYTKNCAVIDLKTGREL